MKIVSMTGIALAMALLAGCAGVTTAVQTHGGLPVASRTDGGASHAQEATAYRLVRTPAQQALSDDPPYEAMLRDGLAKYGFVQRDDGAKYLVSVAWATRPDDIRVGSADCAHDCLPSTGPAFPWFGQTYLHELTLRFFSLPDGNAVYKVTTVKRDRHADAQQALPYLVSGALARLPYGDAPQWRVKLDDKAAAGALPAVVSVAPVER